MDPLSILASVITLGAAVSATLEQLRSLHSADHELQAIINEVSDIRVVFSFIEETIKERQAYQRLSQDHLYGLVRLLESSKAALTVLDTLVKDRLIRASPLGGNPKAARLSWLRQKSKVKSLLEELRSARTSISAIWGASNMSDLSRIHLRLDEFEILHGTNQELLMEQSRHLVTISERVCENKSSDPSISNVSSIETQSSGNNAGEAVASPTSIDNDEQNLIILRRTDDALSPLGKTHTYNTVRIRASRYRRTQCEGWCSCSCHQVNYLRTPQSADLALGSMFIGLSGFPVRRQRCSEKLCHKQSIPTLKVAYHFPLWLLARVVHFSLSLTYMNGPQVSLRMPRVVENNAKIFSLAVQGDLTNMKNLFRDGLASPYDVAASNGRTALHYAVNYSHQELSQFLVDVGADPSLEDKEQASTVTLAWGRIFGGLVRRSTIDAWRCLFDDEEHLESRAFPPLHKIVLGLSSVDLQMQLGLTTAGIDNKDADGRTALSWAATRGDLRSVTLLLQHRADPDMPSMRGQTPLHWVSQNPSQEGLEVLQALLDAGSNVDQIDYWKRTALIYASCNQDDPRCLEILVNGGANLNSQDCHQRTPLGYAAKMGKSKGLEYLLFAGADTRRVDIFGFPPLFEALQNNLPECVRILLQHDPGSVFLDVSGMSALHVAALYSNPETLDALADYGSEQFVTKALDATGTTPQDLFDQREDTTAEHREAFERLTRKARACAMTESAPRPPQFPQAEHEHSDEEAVHEEEFVDALENLDITDGPGGT